MRTVQLDPIRVHPDVWCVAVRGSHPKETHQAKAPASASEGTTARLSVRKRRWSSRWGRWRRRSQRSQQQQHSLYTPSAASPSNLGLRLDLGLMRVLQVRVLLQSRLARSYVA